MENSITIKIEIDDKIYSATMSDDVNFETFMDQFRQLTKVVYLQETVEEYWECD